MTFVFDTSVLVAALVSVHPQHRPTDAWRQAVIAKRIRGALCAHTLAELYATLTVLPLSPLPRPADVERLIGTLQVPPWQVVPLTRSDYRTAVAEIARRGLRSGAVYDALIYRAAEKSDADGLLTLNTGHFLRLRDVSDGWVVDAAQQGPP